MAHAAADLGGWISIALFAFSIRVISLIFRQHVRWKLIGSVGFFFVALSMLFFFLDISYLFLIPLACGNSSLLRHLPLPEKLLKVRFLQAT